MSPGNGASCSSKEIAVIKEHLSLPSDRRELQSVLGPNDNPCLDKCKGFPPGYCYMLFCRRKFYRGLRELKPQKETLSEANLSECIHDLESANDGMNLLFRDRTLSKGCRKLISGSRHYACYTYD
jgi:hypothetical protein